MSSDRAMEVTSLLLREGDRLPTQPLTDIDTVGLRAWVADRAAPVRELAQALLTTGRKAEQEGWFLLHRRG